MSTPNRQGQVTKDAKPEKTGAAKLAQSQQDEVQGVIDTDPTATDVPTAGTGENADVIRLADEVGNEFYDESDGATMVTLKKDVVEEFFYPNTRRPSYRLLYTKGQVVAKSVVDAYNAQTRAAVKARELAENGEVDPVNPAGIDIVTLTGGTYSVEETTATAKAVEAQQA